MSAAAVFLYGAVRTPFGKYQGTLSFHTPTSLGVLAVDELLHRTHLPSTSIGRVYVGAAMLGGATLTLARQIVLGSQLPNSTPSLGVDRACCSGMSAITLAATGVRAGDVGLIVAGGVEVLSRTPRLHDRMQSRYGDTVLTDPLLLRSPFTEGSIASYTSDEASSVQIGRSEQDCWAIESHARYWRAERRGFFEYERCSVPSRPHDRVHSANELVSKDEGPRESVQMGALAALPTVRGSSSITAGNAPGLSDGAAFVVLGDDKSGRTYGLNPIAEIIDMVAVADGPTTGTRTPGLSILKVLERQNMKAQALDVIEINEAFAATPLVSTLVMADFDAANTALLRKKTNPNGGAVAIGHPMGASGTRIIMTMIAELKRRGGGIGVAAICGGFGQGEAIMIKV